MVGYGQVGHRSRGGWIMNNTIGNHDLITAENIMGYLQARCAELEAEYNTIQAGPGFVRNNKLP